MPASTMTQINARIDATLKKRGDEALARAGLSPTQAIRKLWELAARYASEPAKLTSALDPDGAEHQAALRERRRREIDAAIDAGSTLFSEAFSAAGMTYPTHVDERTYDQLRQDAYEEMDT